MMTDTPKHKIQTIKEKFQFGNRLVPLILLILSVITFVPLIQKLGFYWDDWPMLWFEYTQGPQGFADAFTSDRPFLGYLYQVTGAIIGTDPLNWQILTVAFRWLVSCAFWWGLIQLWPEHHEEGFWMACLLTVYSGFKQMPIAYVWGNAFIMLFAYVMSYGMMLKAIRAWESEQRPRYWLWTAAAALCYAFCTISTEYYTGLDLVRGIVIWIFLFRFSSFQTSTFWKKLLKTFLHWLPYLIVLGIFMFWRVFIFQFPSYQPVLLNELAADPIRTTLGMIVRVVEDAYTASWGAWTEFFKFPLRSNLTSVSDRLFWLSAAGAFLFALAALFLYQNNKSRTSPSGEAGTKQHHWQIACIVLGLSALVFPGIPYLITSLSPALDFPRDRWLTAYMFGSCALIVGLVSLLIRGRTAQRIVLSLFIAMAVGGNLLNANTFRRDWEIQKDFVNQLTTRIPDLETPAYFLTDFNSLAYETDNSLTGMVNLALAPENRSLNLPVSVGFYDVRFKSSTDELASEESHFYQGFRSAMYGGDKNHILVYFFSPPGCLRILDPNQHATLPIFPDSFYEFMNFSSPSIIRAEGSREPFLQEKIFKESGAENWCYYFQQADLARQFEAWQTIAAIGDQALPKFQAGEATEYIPFIEAYTRLDRWQDAVPLIEKIHHMNKSLDGPVCPILQKLFVDYYPEDDEIRKRAFNAMYSMGCGAYTQ